MTTGPPTDYPPILLSRSFADEPDGQFSDSARVEGKRLYVTAADPSRPGGYAILDRPLRDTILDVQIELLTRAQGDGAGLYLRQTSERRFVSWVVSHDRRCQIAITDEAPMPVIDAALAPDLVLHVDRPNRMTVVAIGPSLTFVLNGSIVAGVPVDQRYLEGYAGVLVYGGGPEPSEAAIDWIQVRAVLPDQPEQRE